jgi:hypothetical protein
MAVGFPTKVDYATGDVLSAGNMNDLSGTVNLLESAQYAAGKNKIINGDFSVNQRNFTTTTSNNEYGFDRFVTFNSGGTSTYSAQVFAPGTAPVAGYESKNFIRIVSTGQSAAGDNTRLTTRIESVRTLAGQTATLSFWAKASTGTPSFAAYFQQFFGSGGSPSAAINIDGQKTAVTTSWARYSFTFNIPSISGKTLGTDNNDYLGMFIATSAGSDFNARTNSLGIQSATIDFWGVQLEAGSTASPFQTATGTIQGELAACQRYYQRVTAGGAYGIVTFLGNANSTTAARIVFATKQTFRVKPTAVDYANVVLNDGANVPAAGTITIADDNANAITLLCTTTGLTQFRPYVLSGDNNAAGFIGLSAEL